MKRGVTLLLALLMAFNLVVPSIVPVAATMQEDTLSSNADILRDNERKTYQREYDPERESRRNLKESVQNEEKIIDLSELISNQSVELETINSLKAIYSDTQDISNILNKLNGFIKRNKLSEQVKEKLLIELKNGKTLDEIISKHIVENKKDEVEDIKDIISDVDKLTVDARASQFTLNAEDERYSKEYNAPFTIDKGNESINPSDGSLIYTYPIVNLPGVNGLDVNLEAVYNSREAVIWGIVGSTTFNEKNNRMGIGWSWNLPVIEIDEETNYDEPVKYLHLGDGTIYEIWDDLLEDDSNLVGYRPKDIQLQRDSRNFSNADMTSRYVLIEKNGKRTYFGRDGRLLGIQDRHGNTIAFDHILIDDHPVVNRITDTLGRVIRITYREDEVIVRAPGGRRTDLWLEDINHEGRTYNKKALETIVDPIGRKTDIYYKTDKIWFSETDKEDLYTYDIAVNIWDITFPTGVRTEYYYEYTIENLGRYGAIERFRIEARLDYVRKERKIYNEEMYAYSRNNSTGYPSYDSPRRLPSDFTYSSEIENEEGTRVRYIFDDEHLNIEQIVRDASRNMLREEEYKYDTWVNRLPIRIINREYNEDTQDYSSSIRRYTYDDYSNITSEIDELGNETVYDYYLDYFLPASIERYEDGELKEVIEYKLQRPERLDIGEEIRINIVDGEDKSVTTTYQYDIYGNIIEKNIAGTEGTTKEGYQYFEGAYVSGITISDENDLISSKKESAYDRDTGLITSSTDGNGNVTLYEYDEIGRLNKTVNPDQTLETISYDDLNNETTIVDENNYITKITYNALGNHIKTDQEINDRIIASEEKGYNSLSQVEWVKDGNGDITNYRYDSLGRLYETINPDNTRTLIEYKDDERIEEYIDEENKVSYNKYDEAGNIIEEGRFNGRIDEVNYSSYDYNGNILSYIDNEGNETSYNYDQLGNLIEITNSLGETVNYEFDHLGNVIKIITAEGSITAKEYDGSGRLIREKDSEGKIKENIYDLAGNLIEETEISEGDTINKTYKYNSRNWQMEKIDEEGRTTYSYDNIGNILEISDQNGRVINTYNPEGTLKDIIQPDGKTISYEYDDNGNIIETLDYFGESTLNTYDSRNRLKTIAQNNETTQYEYYKNGQTKEVIYSNGTSIHYSYDESGNLIELINIGLDGQIISQYEYSYDKEGNQLSKGENGRISYYTYDSLNRIKSIDEEESTTTYRYDRNGNIKEKDILHSSNSIHTIKNAEEIIIMPNITNHSIRYIYDSSNKLIKSYEEIENEEFIIEKSVDDLREEPVEEVEEVIEETEELVEEVTEEVNPQGKNLEEVNGESIGIPTLEESEPEISLEDVSAIIESNDIKEIGEQNQGVDERELSEVEGEEIVDEIEESEGLEESEEIEELNEENGNIQDEEVDGVEELEELEDFIRLERLNEAYQRNLGDGESYYFGVLNIITEYEYDSQGNLIEKTITEENNHLESQTESYRYNTNNQLIESINNKGERTTYSYSPTGLRDSKTTNGNTIGYFYDRGNVIIETDNGRLMARNLRGHQLISREEGNTKAYYLFNGHGDVTKLIDESEEIIADYEYDIYGLEKKVEEDLINNPYRYAGEYYDEETGLYYLRARYYNPEIGRFISEDTYRGDLMDPLTLNYYVYCQGNPIKYTDPSGNFGELVGSLYEKSDILAAIAALVQSGFQTLKNVTSAGVTINILLKPENAGETDDDLKNDVEFQKWLSGGSTGDPNNGNNKKNDKKDNKQPQNYSLKKFKNNNEANKIARKLGYEGAEALKEDIVPGAGAKFNMKYDSKTHEIVLESIQSGIQVATGLFSK